MRALIVGAGMENKGAELMLRALVSEIRSRFPGIELGLSPGVPQFHRAAKLDLVPLCFPLPNPGYRRFFPLFLSRNLIGRRSTAESWAWRDVDAIFDISGFAYSDQWGLTAARNLERITRDLAKRDGKVILFPQAFGPFQLPGHAESMRRALERVTMVYARDSESLTHLEDLGTAADIRLAPDITLGFSREIREPGGWVAVVPNVRMLDQGAVVWGSAYLSLLIDIVRKIRASGMDARVIVHDEGGGDHKLAMDLSRAVSPPAEVVTDPDPVSLKHLLSRAEFVVGSRFHALASSLACGVPVLALGWSHKYLHLLTGYGIPDLSFNSPSEAIDLQVENLLDDKSRSRFRRVIGAASERIERETEVMWKELLVPLL